MALSDIPHESNLLRGLSGLKKVNRLYGLRRLKGLKRLKKREWREGASRLLHTFWSIFEVVYKGK
jgi:hypothetical protein